MIILIRKPYFKISICTTILDEYKVNGLSFLYFNLQYEYVLLDSKADELRNFGKISLFKVSSNILIFPLNIISLVLISVQRNVGNVYYIALWLPQKIGVPAAYE